MNVLIVTVLASNSPSGVVTYYKTLAQDLTNKGMQVRVVDSLNTPALLRKILVVLQRIMHLFGPASRMINEEFSQFIGMYVAARRLKNFTPDLIHSQDAKSGVAAFLALDKVAPVVMTCHFNDDPVTELIERFPMGDWFRRRLSAWYTYLFAHIKHYVFVSNYVYDKAKQLLPKDAKRIIIHNTVRIESTTFTAGQAESDRLIISNVGYVDERKNQKLLILIGQELRRRGIDKFTIWLIGDGPKRSEYQQLTDELGLTEQVKFYGQQIDPWRLVGQTHLYVHTALNDNCPYSIIEAFAVKTPVLALPVGGIPEMLPMHYGLLRGSTVESLADEVATYFNPEKRLKLRQEQTVYASQHFNHQKSLTDLLSFYHQTEQVA